MSDQRTPAFIVTIDAEGDDLWSNPESVTTRNAAFVSRFQTLCERYQLRPTWLTNHEMATCPVFCEFARDMLHRGTGEIGMHLHAWDSPPLAAGPGGQAYLIEYPEPIMREKIAYMTDLLAEKFERTPVSHRAGRWAFDQRYARALVDFGYTADCSVTPHVSWAPYKGDPDGDGGTDFRGFPDLPYFIDLDCIDRPGNSTLLEVPMSITLVDGRVSWLRPDGDNLGEMLNILRRAIFEQRPCVEFMLHSSELMAGGSPRFSTRDAIESLYGDLESLFDFASDKFSGQTLGEFRNRFAAA